MFLDETGFMLQPVVRRTWAPRGQTPIHYSWDRRDRLSVISAITLSPQRRRFGLYFDIHDHNINSDAFEVFVRWLRRQIRRGIILVLDRWSVHRSGAQRLVDRFGNKVCRFNVVIFSQFFEIFNLGFLPAFLHLLLRRFGNNLIDSGRG